MKNILIVLLCLGLIGCATTQGRPITLKKLSQLEKGITTQEDALKIFGPPQVTNSTIKGRTIWTYTYKRSKASASTYIPVVNILKSGTDEKSQILQILFDENNIYLEHSFREGKRKLKTGMF